MNGFIRAIVLALCAIVVLAFAGCSKTKDAAAVYYCPMHPEVVQDGPGECPICHMTLVPLVEAGAEMQSPDGVGTPDGFAPVHLSADRAKLLGVRFAAVAHGPFARTIRLVGRVAFDERRLHHVHARSDGYIEDVKADFVGKHVRRGEALATLYSPDLLATQEELLLALDAARRAAGPDGIAPPAIQDIVDAAHRRLRLWNVSEREIEEMERTGAPLKALRIDAPISGVVTGRTAYHGMKVTPEETLFDLADLSRVWVLADAYENDLSRLAVGQSVAMTLSSQPGRAWTGRVEYIAPTVDEATRTIEVRADFANDDGALKPGMFADVAVETGSDSTLSIPEDAVLESGSRSVVFTLGADGTLLARDVRTGARTDGRIEVLSGVAQGDSVAVGANFLLDSESRLRSALSAAGAADSSGAGHAGHADPR